MRTNSWQWRKRSLVAVVAAGLGSACAGDGALDPLGGRSTSGGGGAEEVAISQLATKSAHDPRLPELGSCDKLKAPSGSKLSLRSYAKGVQIYRWDGGSWAFVAPSALLLPNARSHGVIGVHYAGPTWQSVSGSKVIAAVIDRCTPDPQAIPWLSLGSVESSGPGVFRGTTFIQRLVTTGGLAPATAGRFVGEEARVPYTAEYLFYRPQ
jgi:hypothetical protein